MLIKDNFMYHHKKILTNGDHVWRCTEYYNNNINCSATICTKSRSHNSHVTSRDHDQHNYVANQTKLEIKKKTENKIKNAAHKEGTANHIVHEVVENVAEDVKDALPPMPSMCRMVTRQRQIM